MIGLALSLLLVSWEPSPNAAAYCVYVNSELVACGLTNNAVVGGATTLPTRIGVTLIDTNGVESDPREVTIQTWQTITERGPSIDGPWAPVITQSFPVVMTNGAGFYRAVVRTEP